MQFNFMAPCYFGVESAATFDFKKIGAQNIRVQDGRIYFSGDETVLADANIWSRCTERILISLAQFNATTFDELFDHVYDINWEDYIPPDAYFPVKGSSLSSTLSSVPACQSIVKKAVVERLKKGHDTKFLPERGHAYRIRFSIHKDHAEVFLDTSGEGLHKRGYRRKSSIAPLKETLAAAIADFSRVRRDSLVEDPFCGSGTLVIESAMKALNMAPGLKREFAAEHYHFLPANLFEKQKKKAQEEIKWDIAFEGFGFDIDESCVALSAHNAKLAGVEKYCTFKQQSVQYFKPQNNAIILANPPYGERLLNKQEAEKLNAMLGKNTQSVSTKGIYILSSDPDFEKHFGRKADKRRKMYNGMISCQIYMYYK